MIQIENFSLNIYMIFCFINALVLLWNISTVFLFCQSFLVFDVKAEKGISGFHSLN